MHASRRRTPHPSGGAKEERPRKRTSKRTTTGAGRDKKKISQPTGSTGRVPRFEPNDRTGKGGTRESLCRAADEGMRRPPGATEQ